MNPFTQLPHSCILSRLHISNLFVKHCTTCKIFQNVFAQYPTKRCLRKIYTTTDLLNVRNNWFKKMKPVRVKRKKPLNGVQGQVIEIRENMTVRQVAQVIGRSIDDVYDALVYTPGGELYDADNASIDDLQIIIGVLKKCGFRYKIGSNHNVFKKAAIEDALPRAIIDPACLLPRPPVVTVMGHVDHGKTTLLDTIRNSRVVDAEFGGITQHIGAFNLELASGDSMTFIDTPGHAAFSAMRARGALVTDIVVLVVAADDGIMQQTLESLEHAKAAKVPIIVAVNKMDKPRANLKETLDGLMEVGVAVEEYGGDVQAVPISALTGKGMVELQEAIVTLAELLELKADPRGAVEGVVIESRTDPGRGKLATAVIQQGTLEKGVYLVAGTAYGKVRAMFSDKNQPINRVGPSTPVEIIGWKELPSAGDQIIQVESEARMKEVIKVRLASESEKKADKDWKEIESKREQHYAAYRQNLDDKRAKGFRYFMNQGRRKEAIETHSGPHLPVILKGDVDGSMEAILDTIDTYDSSKCHLDIVHFGIGDVTATDVEMADTFGAIIYGFNVASPANITKMAEDREVSVRVHRVIYRLFDDLKADLTNQLPPSIVEEIIGEATVQEVYKVTDRKKKINVAGCRCTKGTVSRKQLFRLVRDGDTVHEGKLSSLRHFKNEVDTVKTDIECGLCFEEKNLDFARGDVIQCYSLTPVKQTIDWNLGF